MMNAVKEWSVFHNLVKEKSWVSYTASCVATLQKKAGKMSKCFPSSKGFIKIKLGDHTSKVTLNYKIFYAYDNLKK